MLAALMSGLVLGLSAGGYCLGACAPAMVPYLVSSGCQGAPRSFRILGEFLAGRLAAYLLLAALAMLLGRQVQHLPVSGKAIGGLMAALGIALVLHGLSLSFPEWRLCGLVKRSAALRRFPFAAGIVLGVNVCPPLVAAFARLMAVNQWLPGLAFSAAFFVGTAALLAPLFLMGYAGRLGALRGVSEVAAVFSGLWFIAQGVAMGLG